MSYSRRDAKILRDIARRLAEIAHLPVMDERRALWKRHHRLERVRPMVLVFPEGAWAELLPEDVLQCEDPDARKIEWALRHRIYWHEHIPDDYVFEPCWVVNKAVTNTGWGVASRHVPSPMERGAWAFDPVIKEPSDLQRLRFPEVIHDETATQRSYAEACELFDGILEVKLKGIAHISFHLMALYCDLRGLEQVMLDMCVNPAMLHDAMAFFEEGHHHLIRQYEKLNLFSLNNDDTYHSSGGIGYTDELPGAGFTPERVRPCDMWASAEAQELAQVGPEMHREFSLEHERRLLAPFGLNGYGCCEDLTLKLDDVLTIPRLRRVSISPFADVETCAEKLGRKCIFSWKPHPAHLVGDFNDKCIRRYLAHTLDVTRGCVVEMILKDTHTCEGRPERFTQWAQIAHQLAEQY